MSTSSIITIEKCTNDISSFILSSKSLESGHAVYLFLVSIYMLVNTEYYQI